jgi:hypothetical protein
VRWWIEGAQINWELGVAKQIGGYESPIMETCIHLARKYFEGESIVDSSKKPRKSRPKKIARRKLAG